MNTEPIPGVIAIIQQGIAIYKEEWKTLIGLNALYLGFSFLGLAAFIGSLLLVATFIPSLGVVGLILASIVGIVVFVCVVWVLVRILLGVLYTVRDYDSHLNIREAIARGKGKVLPFLWVMVLTLLVVIGSLICVWIACLIIAFPFYYVAPQIAGVLMFVLVLVGSLLSILVTGSWFAFSVWLFVDQDARGLHALAISKHLSHKHLGAVMWRLFCIYLFYFFGLLILRFILAAVFSFLPPATANILAQLFTNIVICFTLIPILYSSLFSLYTSVEATQVIDTDSTAHGEHRGILITLAVCGFLAACVLPAVFGFLIR